MSRNTNKRQHNVRKMQHTSRFTPKIREYLAALPNERELELERFMALSSSSPASSVSVGAHSSDAVRSGSRSRCSSSGNVVVATVTEEAPTTTTTTTTEPETAACAAAMECVVRGKNKGTQVINIPIVMETRAGSSGGDSKPTASASVEDLRTPTKGTQTTTPQMQTRKTQTPESALKSHKRLEWDPAADVGYRCERAASVSNISTLERSVLEAAMQPNRSESDLNRLLQQQQPQQQEVTVPPSSGQPPLASSTFVNSRTMTTPVPSQSSRRESGVTSAASSFDYQHHHHHHNSSRRSSTAATTTTSRSSNSSRHTLSAEELLRHVEQQRQEREYAAQLQQVLCSKRSRHQNKENQQPQPQTAAPPSSRAKSSTSSSIASNASSSSCPPARGDLDLGVDLLCSLVNKRSLSHGQKKQLIRDIAKRLACLDLVGNNGSSGNSRAESARSSRRSQHKEQQPQEQQPQEQQPQEQQPQEQSCQPKETCLSQDKATNTSNRSSLDKPIQKPVVFMPAATECAPNTLPVPAPRTRIATPTEGSPLLPCSYASTSSGASNELVTQKTNLRPKSRNSTDAAELSAMREWLHPLTQSEIDYEEKQAQMRSSLDKERRSQLDWIDTEIRRLRMLQNLLNTASKEANLTTPPSSQLNIPIVMVENEQRQSQRPAPPAPPVTPVEPTATTRPPRQLPPPPPPPPPAPSRPLPPTPPSSNPPSAHHHQHHRPMQRSKMATPNTLSHSGSSESVCSFVQQRQRQFMAHYQNQQQQRLEQQQQLFKLQQQQQQQQQQLIHKQQQEMHPICSKQRHDYQPHYIQMQYTQGRGTGTGRGTGNAYSCVEDEAVYYHVVESQLAPCQVPKTTTATNAVLATEKTTTTIAAPGNCSNNSCTATTSSTSSMLCISSSEMSIPMGMVSACEATTTTTTTTTHQYDDVACHHQQQQQLQLHQRLHQQHREMVSSTDEQRQQMLKVRPRGIAYAIQFTASGDVSEMLSNALSLQEHLQIARPLFCAQSKQRKAILNEMQLLRNERRRELDQVIENSSMNSLDRRLKQLPPPVTSRVRIFTTKEMKALTNKRCEYLPEVLAAQNREQEERRRRSNRIMRDVFNRRLQRRVRCGKLSLNHSRTVI